MLAWSGPASGSTTGVAFVRSFQRVPQGPSQPMPASSRMDPLLAKTKPIRNDRNTSVITDLKRKKKSYCTVVISTRGDGMRI